MMNPRAPASDWMRSPELSCETSARSVALVRSSVAAVSTARPMPALSFSIETCIATIPIRPKATMTTHARLRTRRSIVRLPETSSAASATRSAIAAPPATTRSGRSRRHPRARYRMRRERRIGHRQRPAVDPGGRRAHRPRDAALRGDRLRARHARDARVIGTGKGRATHRENLPSG